MKISILNKNYYPKRRVCTKNGICGTCVIWRKGYCYGFFSRIITEEDLKIIKNKLGEIVKKAGYITKDELRDFAKKHKLKLTDRLLYHYCDLGLIEKSIMRRLLGKHGGTISLWREETPKLLYMIQNLKKLGYRIKLREIKYWLNLLKLDKKAFLEIKKIINEKEYLEKYLYSRGTSSKQRKKLKKLYPVLFCEVLLSRYDVFEDLVSFRSKIEIYEETEKILNEAKTKVSRLELEAILDNPAIETNIDEVDDIKEAYILVKYDAPFNIDILFKKNEIKIIK